MMPLSSCFCLCADMSQPQEWLTSTHKASLWMWGTPWRSTEGPLSTASPVVKAMCCSSKSVFHGLSLRWKSFFCLRCRRKTERNNLNKVPQILVESDINGCSSDLSQSLPVLCVVTYSWRRQVQAQNIICSNANRFVFWFCLETFHVS